MAVVLARMLGRDLAGLAPELERIEKESGGTFRDSKAGAEARDAAIARVARAAWDKATTTKR